MKHLKLKRLKKIISLAGKFTFYLIFLILIAGNIFSSQNISPLYFQLAKESRGSVVTFLSTIKNLSDFPALLEINKKIYGDSLENEVFAEKIKRKEKIMDFESSLQKNPDSRDTLYNLYLLYQDDGNETKAGEYLKKAKHIDPSIE